MRALFGQFSAMPPSFARYLLIFALSLGGVFGLVWAYVACVPMGFMDSGYAGWEAKSDMLNACRLGQLAFFGDSRLDAAVIPAGFGVETRNFALPGATVLETSVAVERATRCPVLPKQVVISLIPDHFGPVPNLFWSLTLRYGFLTARDVLGLEREAAALGDRETFSAATPDGLGGWPRDWLYLLRFPSFSFANLVRARLWGRYRANLEHYAEVIGHEGWSPYPAGPLELTPPLDGFKTTKLQLTRFAAAVRALQAKGVDVLFMAAPFRAERQETDAYLASYRALMTDFARQLGIGLLDDGPPIWPNRLFADGSHLDPEGARLFTARVAGCMTGGRLRPGCDLSWQDGRSAVLQMQQ